jgi:hypothetical protein
VTAKRKTSDIGTARWHLNAAARRLKRQQNRVARQIAEGRDTTAARKLLSTFEKRVDHARYFMEALEGWHRKHPHRRIDKRVKRRLLNRKVRDGKNTDKSTQWTEQVRAALDKQFPAAPHYKGYMFDLWRKYVSLGLPKAHFVSEICSGKTDKVAQRVWEMMLAAHFDALGFSMTSADEGPDLRIEQAGRVAWVEAVCPTAAGLPEQWIKPISAGEFIVGDVPHNETLLRWTTAIDEKRRKLAEYRKKGLVRPEDSFVIAVNGGQLGRMPLNEGVSQMPYALEAVYPAGPTSIEIDRSTGQFVRSFKSLRPQVKNANGEPVPTTIFMNPENADISAVIGYSSDRSKTPLLTADLVHNHLAACPIPQGLMGPDNIEWGKVAENERGIEIGKLDSSTEHLRAATGSEPKSG